MQNKNTILFCHAFRNLCKNQNNFSTTLTPQQTKAMQKQRLMEFLSKSGYNNLQKPQDGESNFEETTRQNNVLHGNFNLNDEESIKNIQATLERETRIKNSKIKF